MGLFNRKSSKGRKRAVVSALKKADGNYRLDPFVERAMDIKKNQFRYWLTLQEIREDDDLLNLREVMDMSDDEWLEGTRRVFETLRVESRKAAVTAKKYRNLQRAIDELNDKYKDYYPWNLRLVEDGSATYLVDPDESLDAYTDWDDEDLAPLIDALRKDDPDAYLDPECPGRFCIGMKTAESVGGGAKTSRSSDGGERATRVTRVAGPDLSKMTKEEIYECALRDNLRAEQDAILTYNKYINVLPVGDPVRKGLEAIRDEEREHSGELYQLLFQTSADETFDFEEGREEVVKESSKRKRAAGRIKSATHLETNLYDTTGAGEGFAYLDFDSDKLGDATSIDFEVEVYTADEYGDVIDEATASGHADSAFDLPYVVESVCRQIGFDLDTAAYASQIGEYVRLYGEAKRSRSALRGKHVRKESGTKISDPVGVAGGEAWIELDFNQIEKVPQFNIVFNGERQGSPFRSMEDAESALENMVSWQKDSRKAAVDLVEEEPGYWCNDGNSALMYEIGEYEHRDGFWWLIDRNGKIEEGDTNSFDEAKAELESRIGSKEKDSDMRHGEGKFSAKRKLAYGELVNSIADEIKSIVPELAGEYSDMDPEIAATFIEDAVKDELLGDISLGSEAMDCIDIMGGIDDFKNALWNTVMRNVSIKQILVDEVEKSASRGGRTARAAYRKIALYASDVADEIENELFDEEFDNEEQVSNAIYDKVEDKFVYTDDIFETARDYVDDQEILEKFIVDFINDVIDRIGDLSRFVEE